MENHARVVEKYVSVAHQSSRGITKMMKRLRRQLMMRDGYIVGMLGYGQQKVS